MTRGILLAAWAMVLVTTTVGCAARDVHASDYDQSCAKDDDCVAITELEADGTSCRTGCSSAAINEKDLATYQEDFADSRGKCSSMASPFCEVSGTPACIGGKCAMKN